MSVLADVRAATSVAEVSTNAEVLRVDLGALLGKLQSYVEGVREELGNWRRGG